MMSDDANRPAGADAGSPPPNAPAWRTWVGGLLAIGLSAATIIQLKDASAESIAILRGLSSSVWIAFAVLLFVQPTADFVIFRRLWRLPVAGVGVILRKTVINEVLFGYAGEVYFYLWARRQSGLYDAPFGAIKDVNLISALAANVLTLILLLVSIPGLKGQDLAREFGPVLWPGLGLIALTFGVLFFARRVFSLTRGELEFVALVHSARLAATTGLTILLWYLALPAVALSVWMALLAGRLLLARLPFLPNKELLFANLLLILFGAGSSTALLLATLAVVTILANLGIISIVSALDLTRRPR